MMNSWMKLTFRGIIILIFQVLLLNNINFWGVFNPKLYPIFLLLFARILKPSYFMTIGIAYGFLADMFSQTYGIGMASCVLICFLRPYILRLLSNRKDEDDSETIAKFRDTNFLVRYLSISLLIFHLVYFSIEMGELYNPFYIIWKSFLSTCMALLCYVLSRMVFQSGSRQKTKMKTL